MSISENNKAKGRIFCLMGKSASGKDTIYTELGKRFPKLKKIILYTSRPKRDTEIDGIDYHFTTKEKLDEFSTLGKVIEIRRYETIHGAWYYATIDDGSLDFSSDYLAIGTLESYRKLRDYFSAERVVPVYIEVESGIRLQRALDRERKQDHPRYEEMCRRFLADEKDFSEENIAGAGIGKRYENIELSKCIEEIVKDLSLQFSISR